MTVFDSCNLSYLTVKRLWSYSFIGGKGAIALENRGWKEEGGKSRALPLVGHYAMSVAAAEGTRLRPSAQRSQTRLSPSF